MERDAVLCECEKTRDSVSNDVRGRDVSKVFLPANTAKKHAVSVFESGEARDARGRQKVCPAEILSLTAQDDRKNVCPPDLLENLVIKRILEEIGRTDLLPVFLRICVEFRPLLHSRKTETARAACCNLAVVVVYMRN